MIFHDFSLFEVILSLWVQFLCFGTLLGVILGVPWGSLGPSRGFLGASLTLSWHHFLHYGGPHGPFLAILGLFCHVRKPIEAFWHIFEAFFS